MWRARLDPNGTPRPLLQTLSAGERQRAREFGSPEGAFTFAASRGFVRSTLARYTGEAAADLRLAQGPHGKPYLVDHPDVGFNLSHSGGLALCAVTRAKSVGVDVERTRPVDHDAIARRFFSEEESEAIGALPADMRRAAFFACWVRKEAVVKAAGAGLSSLLRRFSVPVAPDGPAAVIELVAGDGRCWTVLDVDAGSGYAAAVAVEGTAGALRCWDWGRYE